MVNFKNILGNSGLSIQTNSNKYKFENANLKLMTGSVINMFRGGKLTQVSSKTKLRKIDNKFNQFGTIFKAFGKSLIDPSFGNKDVSDRSKFVSKSDKDTKKKNNKL
jgi:hypothetical protein